MGTALHPVLREAASGDPGGSRGHAVPQTTSPSSAMSPLRPKTRRFRPCSSYIARCSNWTSPGSTALFAPRSRCGLPVVLTETEVRALLGELSGLHWLVAGLLYGAGLRVMDRSAAYLHARLAMLPPVPFLAEKLNSEHALIRASLYQATSQIEWKRQSCRAVRRTGSGANSLPEAHRARLDGRRSRSVRLERAALGTRRGCRMSEPHR